MSRFNLPVMKSTVASSPEDVLRLTLRAEEFFDATLAEPAPLDVGLVLFSEEFPDLPAANQVRDVAFSPDRPPADAVTEVEAFFTQKQLTCHAWLFADGRCPDNASALLETCGYQRRRRTLWLLERARMLATNPTLTLIPGRASFLALATLAEETCGSADSFIRAQHRTAAARRLDDTRVDSLLALDGVTPVGVLSFVTNGQLGHIAALHVHPDHRRRHVGATLLMAAMELAARSQTRHVTLLCDAGDLPAETLCRNAGFTPIASVNSFNKR